MQADFETYLNRLREMPPDDQTEHTGRSALEELLRQFAANAEGEGRHVQHEPKRVKGKGAPDFKITKDGSILGYVETKPLGTSLTGVLKSAQIKNYRSLSPNLIVTDYCEFIWLNGDNVQRARLCDKVDIESLHFQLRDDRAAGVAQLLRAFFSTAPKGIDKAEDLALALAARSRLLREYLAEELLRQEREDRQGKLYGLHQAFKEQVSHELEVADFADAFAQMLAYGLFLARLNSGRRQITLSNAPDNVPSSFRLIRELVDFLTVLDRQEYKDVRWLVVEVLSIVNGMDTAAIHEDLSFRHRKIRRGVRAKSEDEARLFERDPFVYFYEDYLSRHNPKERETRGVYYTPPPIVNFIIRAIDDTLKDGDVFGIPDGLADHSRVTVLDFACGTGTFLLEIFERIFETIGGTEAGKASLVVSDHILKNVYGFEYLLAPYTIAHLKLSQYLTERGHSLKEEERLPIYLTNTLEPIEPQRNYLLPELSHEVEVAQEIKEKPILVITGNPPYSGHSRNMGPVARASIEAYKWVDGERLREKNLKWLQDDYVKFLRFAQKKMDDVDEGIVGVITNHSYLDNPTFRGMRQSLLQTFDQIYLLDLHGNTKKRERAPDGGDDQNVFDIQQGVAIALLIKKPGLERGVWHADLWGKRLKKYRTVMDTTHDTVGWSRLNPVGPYYLFIPYEQSDWLRYEEGWPLNELFNHYTMGIITKRDKLTISISKQDIWQRVVQFSEKSPDELRRKFNIPSDNDWTLHNAIRDISASGPSRENLKPISYAPFDTRYTYYTGVTRGFMARPVRQTMRHLLQPNFAISTIRKLDILEDWTHAFVCDGLMTHHAVSQKEGNYIFAAYLYDDQGNFVGENISNRFREFVDECYASSVTPDNIIGYIYSILFSPSYRARYAEFLKIDFPRIPFPESMGDFVTLSQLGWALMQAHLLRDFPRCGLAGYHGRGEDIVEKPSYAPEQKAVWINASRYFAPVPLEVWNFKIGGYQVLENYLKARKGRTLTLDEVTHVANMADCISFTINQMEKIDEAYRAAFPDRG